jgi:hypothetical protein
MGKYFSVGHREPCGHHHRTRPGAERCARSFLWQSCDDLRMEAQERGLGLQQYIRSIIAETTGDCLIAEITPQ